MVKYANVFHVNTFVALLASLEICFWFESMAHLSWASVLPQLKIYRRSCLHAYARLIHEIW